ncbi:EamA family transporter [Pseudomonas phoenicis]|uniref:EamA family transporter n=1 Tax=unclassified Pseudomonas TaxID=196821 RepID=UPI00399FA988
MNNEIKGLAPSLTRGHFLNVIYAILTAVAIVFLSYAGTDIPMAAALFYMATGSSIIFNFVEASRFKSSHLAVFRYWQSWLVMSIAFILNWVFSYYSATHSAPEFYVSVFFLTSAGCASLAARDGWKAIACMLAASSAYILTQASIAALMSTVLAGISIFTYFVISRNLAMRANLSANSIIAVRCYLMTLGTFGYLLIHDELAHLAIPAVQVPSLLILVFFNMVIPSFLSQTCLHYLGIARFTQINSFIPVLVFVFQTIFLSEWNIPLLLTCILATVALNSQNFIKTPPR